MRCIARMYLQGSGLVICSLPVGLNYCRGLAARYSSRDREALRFFNAARRDHEW